MTYTCVWASILTIFTCINFTHKIIDMHTWVFIANVSFLFVTCSFVLIPPVGRWVDKHVIDKFP